jgi:Tol biopolymer transport system component
MGDEGLYIVDIASREKRRLTDKPCDLSPVWGPDGRHILFVSNRADPSGLDIWKLDVEGGELVNLTKGKGKNWSPAWLKE